MRIKFLGSGSAFVLGEENYHSNIVITHEGKNLLYDVGTTIPDALDKAELTPQDIDTIFISHLHADHAGGVEYLAFKTYFEQFPFGVKKIKLKAHHNIITNGWDHTWRGGLQSIQGQTNTLENYFDVAHLQDNSTFDFFGVEMIPIQTIHVVDNQRHIPSYGMMFDAPDGCTVFITGDTQFTPNRLIPYFEQSDIIFHDCEFANYPGGVHAQFHQLCDLPEDIKAKMWLYHYKIGSEPLCVMEDEVKDAGFAGLVKRGQEFNTES